MKKASFERPTQRKSLKNNYLPLVVIVGLLLFSNCVLAQFYDSTKVLQYVNAYGYAWKNGKFRGPLILGNDTSKLAKKDSGAIAFKHGKFWGNNGYGWNEFGGSTPTWQQTLSVTDGNKLTTDHTINGNGNYLLFDNLSSFGTTADNISIYANVEGYLYGPFWEVDNELIANGKFLARDSAIFQNYGLLSKKFNYATNINGSLDNLSLVPKKYVDSLIALPNSNSWNKTGNSGTIDGTNFIGTTDNIPFNFRVNNQKSGRIDPVDFNTFFGYLCGKDNTTGELNTAIGYNAFKSNTSGFGNSSIGGQTLQANINGANNTAIGFGSLYSNTSGQSNTALGYKADVGSGGLFNATAIGSYAYVTTDNSIVLGAVDGINDAPSTAKVGIGVNAPSERLHVEGNLRLVNGSQGAGKVLMSDANGVSTWSGSMPVNLITTTTDVGNIGAGEDNLMTYTIPAGKLATNGDYLEFTMSLSFGANANNKQVKVYFGSTTIYASGAQAQNDGSMEIKGTIVRTGATSQRITFSQANNTLLFPDYSSYVTASETMANTIVIKATGEATSDNDIVQKVLTVKYFPAN